MKILHNIPSHASQYDALNCYTSFYRVAYAEYVTDYESTLPGRLYRSKRLCGTSTVDPDPNKVLKKEVTLTDLFSDNVVYCWVSGKS